MVFKNIFANQLIIHILILICTYVSFCRWEGPQRTETNEYTPFSQKALLFTMEHMWQLFQLNICVFGALFMTICARKMLSDSQLVPTTVDSPRTSVSLPLHHFSSSPNTTLCTKEFLKLSFFVTCSSSWFEWAQTWFDLIWIDLTWLDSTWLNLTWLDSTWLNLNFPLLRTSLAHSAMMAIYYVILCVQITTTYVRFVESKSFSLSYGALDG